MFANERKPQSSYHDDSGTAPYFENNRHSWSEYSGVSSPWLANEMVKSLPDYYTAPSYDRSYSDPTLSNRVGSCPTMSDSSYWKHLKKKSHLNFYSGCSQSRAAQFSSVSWPECMPHTSETFHDKSHNAEQINVNTYHYPALQDKSNLTRTVY